MSYDLILKPDGFGTSLSKRPRHGGHRGLHAELFQASLPARSRFRASGPPKLLPAAGEALNRPDQIVCSQALRDPAVLTW